MTDKKSRIAIPETGRVQRLDHPFGPLYNENSRVLILGSFPSVRSREQNFFYGHPQNRFWKVIAAVFDQDVPQAIDEKKMSGIRLRAARSADHRMQVSGMPGPTT